MRQLPPLLKGHRAASSASFFSNFSVFFVLSVVPPDSPSAAMASLETGLLVLAALPSTDSLLQAALIDSARNPASVTPSAAASRPSSTPRNLAGEDWITTLTEAARATEARAAGRTVLRINGAADLLGAGAM